MAIVETSWKKLLSQDSQIPPDVFFLVEGEDDGNAQSEPIGAHRIFLGGVSSVFMGMLFGPMKDTREVIEVSGTTHEAFNTMINYIYKPPTSRKFFPAPQMNQDEDHENFNDEENPDNQNRIRCPQKFFDLLDLAEKYEIFSMERELTSDETLAITNNNVIFTAQVAKNYQKLPAFEDVSTKLLAKCLKFLLKKTSIQAGDIWTRFWALVNNTKDPEKELRDCVAFQESLARTPFADLTISHALIKETLEKMGHDYYDQCLYLACSGVHVRWEIQFSF